MHHSETTSEVTTVIINGIWFSPDGSVKPSVIDNLQELKLAIQSSGYEKFYQVCLWTDAEKLDSDIKIILEETGIIIKDYRDVPLHDAASITMLTWIKNLIELGQAQDRLPYAMASDTLRLFLLLKVYPALNPHVVTIYIDYNDMKLKNIPDPYRLKAMLANDECGLAFNLLHFKFNRELLKGCNISWSSKPVVPMVNNDVIIAYYPGHEKMFALFFQCHLNNLEYMDALIRSKKQHGFIEEYQRSQPTLIHSADRNMALAIEFTIPHLFNVFVMKTAPEVFLFNWRNTDTIDVTPVRINTVLEYINVEHIKQEGLTWVPSNSQLFKRPQMNEMSEFWKELFRQRYTLTSAMLTFYTQQIDIKIYFPCIKHNPMYSVSIANGASMLKDNPELTRIYQKILHEWKQTNGDKMQYADNLAKSMLYLNQHRCLNDQIIAHLTIYPEQAIAKDWVKLAEIDRQLPQKILEIYHKENFEQLIKLGVILFERELPPIDINLIF